MTSKFKNKFKHQANGIQILFVELIPLTTKENVDTLEDSFEMYSKWENSQIEMENNIYIKQNAIKVFMRIITKRFNILLPIVPSAKSLFRKIVQYWHQVYLESVLFLIKYEYKSQFIPVSLFRFRIIFNQSMDRYSKSIFSEVLKNLVKWQTLPLLLWMLPNITCWKGSVIHGSGLGLIFYQWLFNMVAIWSDVLSIHLILCWNRNCPRCTESELVLFYNLPFFLVRIVLACQLFKIFWWWSSRRHDVWWISS